MSFQRSSYSGDAEYSIDCTGDAVVGNEVRFERPTFTGSFRNAKFAGFEQITARIERDSYGQAKQQHTFALRTHDGNLLQIKGRNLYGQGVWRKAWVDETQRHAALNEKHHRGEQARAERMLRTKVL